MTRVLFYRKFNYLAFVTVIVFVFFDGVRSNLLISTYLSLIREIVSIYLIILSFSKNKLNILTPAIRLFYLYHLIIILFSYINDGAVEISFILKPLEYPLYILVFFSFERLTGRPIDKLIDIIVKTSVVFCILNVVLYFMPLPIWNRDAFWIGRISCGYPTMDVVSLSYTLLLLLFYPELKCSNFQKTCICLMLIVSILLNFSGTGIVLLTLILLLSLFYISYNPNKKVIRNSLLLILFFGTSVTTTFSRLFPQEFEMGISLMQNKVDILLGNEVDTNTMEIREEQLSHATKNSSYINRLLGAGLNNMTMHTELMDDNHNLYHIENQFGMLYVGYGIIGLILFVFMILYNTNLAVRCKTTVNVKLLYILSMFVVLINSNTLVVFMMFPNVVLFAFFSFLLLKKCQEKHGTVQT